MLSRWERDRLVRLSLSSLSALPENFSASSDLAGKLVSVDRSHRKLISIRREIVSFVFRQRTHQHRQISQENSSSLSKLAGKLVRITGSRRIDYRIVEKKIIVVIGLDSALFFC
ncbi:hypothetical protein HID58_031664 [Brassica napus]|uniref:Uncharacterized protein n=1 Tax=Brassica napus TaxID=3708 RepID=A0ABQ8BUA4_BRANA|nr:hypothetical protein HID58_031664 [Brassica napus]